MALSRVVRVRRCPASCALVLREGPYPQETQIKPSATAVTGVPTGTAMSRALSDCHPRGQARGSCVVPGAFECPMTCPPTVGQASDPADSLSGTLVNCAAVQNAASSAA